jgi:mRNA interferase MazF
VEGLVRGDIVVVPFPFTDLNRKKRRTALVLAVLSRHDAVICQITSQSFGHPYSVPITSGDYIEGMGRLPRESFVLPHRLVTASTTLFDRVVGRLKPEKMNEVAHQIFEILS